MEGKIHSDARTRNDSTRLHNPMEEKAIAQLAYKYWEQRGKPIGSPLEDWFRAEQELQSECTSMAAFLRR